MTETITPQILFTEQFNYTQPLKGTKYVEKLSTVPIFGGPTEKDRKNLKKEIYIRNVRQNVYSVPYQQA